MMDDRRLTRPDVADAGARAAIFRLLGDVYRAAGQSREAQETYRKAETLDFGRE